MVYFDVMPLATHEIASLSEQDYERVRRILDVLNDHPRAAQTAGIRGAREVRRAVAGKYLIFYRYIEESNTLRIYSVRHGARKPPTRKDLFPEA